MEPLKINPSQFEKLIDDLKKDPEAVAGNYLLKGYRIQISPYQFKSKK